MTEEGKKIPVNIEDEMRVAYLDYAMSVIIGRALPDVRDGLKPVHRRILYAMHELGNVWNKAFKKSARVVGDVIGKYHPHGDTAVYDAIVRLAQDFSMRSMLIDGQGNFGSVDGDSPAAMRYTEIRMTKLVQELIEDLEKETVNFGANYDDTLMEPLVFPGKFPNLLVNGSSGIAVGMATNIPPHNIGEVIDGTVEMIDNPDITVLDLMSFIKGPDFPTAGFIHGISGIESAYLTGRGSVQMRARTEIETDKSDKEHIIVTELPYQVNKAKLVEKIAELVKDKKIDGITDLRDESDRDGMRVVVSVRKGENSHVIINQLFKHTQMQDTFGVIMLAIVDNQPKVMDLKTILHHFINHRIDVVTKRTIFELRKAEERRHLLDGLKIALDNIDQVVNIIKNASSPSEAQQELVRSLNIDMIQSKAILEMRLQRLTGLERQKILDELKQLLEDIDRYNTILGSEDEKKKIIKNELIEIKDKYSDPRRTEIIAKRAEYNLEDLIAKEEMVVTVSHKGYIKRTPLSLYRSQRRGGTGSRGMTVRDEDFTETLFTALTHDYIMFFSNIGKVHVLKVYEIPQSGRDAKGKSMASLLNLNEGEVISATLSVKEFTENKYLVMATERGVIKKTSLYGFKNLRTGGIIAITLDENDKLISVGLAEGEINIFLATRNGQSIQFKDSDVRMIGRPGRGVRGITLIENDYVVGMEICNPGKHILTVTENGFGKRTDISEYRNQKRSGKGIINIKVSERNGKVAGISAVTDDDDIMIIASDGNLIRMKVKEISIIGRNTQGVRLIDTRKGGKVIDVERLEGGEEEEEEKEENGDTEDVDNENEN